MTDSTCFVEESKDVWKKRYPGLIDCTGTIDWVGDREPSELNVVGEIDITCKGTKVFYCKFMRYMGMSNYSVDPSSGSLVGGSSSFNMMAHDDSGTIGALTALGISLFPPSKSSSSSSSSGS